MIVNATNPALIFSSAINPFVQMNYLVNVMNLVFHLNNYLVSHLLFVGFLSLII
jgi:hypothetical protein